jgi:hypothetical protein
MIADVGMFLFPYVLVFALGGVLGFLSRNGTVDRLGAENLKLKAELSGVEIRTSRTEPDPEPVRPVQRRTGTARTAKPAYGPVHTGVRTETLPAGVRYVAATAEETGAWLADPESDRPMTDDEYAQYVSELRNT